MKTCQQCGTEMPDDAPEGLCPRCLISAAAKRSDISSEPTRIMPESGAAASASQNPDIGDAAEVARRLPQFEILELLGRGGMGVVYKARQPQLDRLVALKILPPAEALTPDFVERFRREARSLAKLSHPNIVTVYEFGESGGLYYFVMELVDGVNLREMIRTGKMKPEEALAVVPKICAALQFAHEEGVVHRDVKPENILIDKRGRVKIADFGLAKLLRREQADHTLTMSGMTLGTPRYMAPEQLDKPESVDHRADIYSLGVVFYEMLTGEVPMGRFAPPSEKVRIDVRLDEIVLHALERDVERRYQHVSQVRDDVENVTSTTGATPRIKPEAPDGEDPAVSQPPASMTRSPLFWTVVLCALGALSTLLTWTTFDKVTGHQPGATFSRIVEGKANAYFTWHGVAALFLFVVPGLFVLVTKLDRRHPVWSAAIAIATALGTAIVETLQVISVNHALVALMAPKHFGFEVSVISQPGVGVFLAYGASLGILISGFLQLRRFLGDPVQLPRTVQPGGRPAAASENGTDVEKVTSKPHVAQASPPVGQAGTLPAVPGTAGGTPAGPTDWKSVPQPGAPPIPNDGGVKKPARHLLSALLVLLCLFGFFFGFSFHAKTGGTAAGITKILTVGAIDPLFTSESGPSGFSTNLNFFSWSFFAVVVAGIAFGAVWRIGREDKGKVPRDPAWWRDWWKQVGVWGGLLLTICVVRTVMDPAKVLQPPGDRTVASRFMGLFSSGPEFREDPSRIPATRTAGRTDYAYTFSAPANHRLYVWIEWWKGGEGTIDRDCNTAYVARRGDRLERSLQVIFNDGNIAGPATKGQVRIDWLFDDGTGNSTSGRWRPDFFEGLATSVSLDRIKSWKPKVGETVNLLEIRGGKESIDGNPVTEERLRAGRWEAVMILRARVEAVPESRMWEGTITKMNAWNDNEEPSPALLRVGEQFGATLDPFTDARNLREQIAYRIKKDAAERAKAVQMLKDAGSAFTADEKPDDLVKKLESIPAKTPAAPKTGEASKEPAAAQLAPAQDLRFAIQQDRSQLPATAAPGRQDYAFKFSGPADHTLNVWMEVWQEGRMEWVSDFDFEAKPKAGEPLAASLTLTAMGGDAASKESKGKTRLDWTMNCGGSEGKTHTANALIADLSAGMGATYSTWDRQPKTLNPHPGETVTVLGITGYELSNFRSVAPTHTETDLIKRWPNAAVLIRARFSPARSGQLSDAVGLGTKVSDQNFERHTFAQFEIGKQLGVELSDCRTPAEAHAALVAAASTPDGRVRAAQMVDELGSDNIAYADQFRFAAEPMLAMWWKLRKKEAATAEEVVGLLESFITAVNGPGSHGVQWNHGEPIIKWAEGPLLKDDFAKKLKLTKLQVDEVNKLFKKYADEANALKRRHTKVTKNDQGHVLINIEPYSEECLELARKMVAELGGIVTQDIVPAVKVGALPSAIFGKAGECRETIVLKKDAEGVYVIRIITSDWVPAGEWRGDNTTGWGSKDIDFAFGSYKMYWTEE